ncbi:MAG: N-acetylmuramoyl-L-alanine amidase [Oceanicaulis sp.]
MRVVSHRLLDENGKPVSYEESPNRSGVITPRFLVIHYTAGRSLQSTVNWFQNKQAKASAHLVIGRKGEIVQMVPFNRKAWHAGRSSWGEATGLNNCSIGIELDNAGELSKTEGGEWRAWFGETYKDKEVLVAPHRLDPPGSGPSGWHVFTPEQLDALHAAAAALHEKYGFEAVLGHDDIAPNRKRDPGPAFPMSALRGRLYGRAEDEADEGGPEDCPACGKPVG